MLRSDAGRARQLKRSNGEVTANAATLQEESRALTSGVVDALAYAPTNAAVVLASSLARRDQDIEGLPLARIAVEPLLTNSAPAWAALVERFDFQEELLAARTKLAAENEALKGKLVAMGELYEAERNKKIWKRFWKGSLLSLIVTGLIVLVVVCPIVLPLLGHFLAWAVSKIPALASWLGVVGKSSFDGLVRGVGITREVWKATGKQERLQSDNNLYRETDVADRRLIDYRRRKVAEGI